MLLFGNLREKCGTIAKQYRDVCITHTNLMSAHILTKFTTNLYPHTCFSSGDDLSIGNSSLLPTQPAIVIIVIGKTLYISTKNTQAHPSIKRKEIVTLRSIPNRKKCNKRLAEHST